MSQLSSNQLKKRLLKEEPAGLIHNPRARRVRRGGEGQSHPMLIILLVLLAVGVAAVFLLAPGHFGTLLAGNHTGQPLQPPAPASAVTGTERQQPPAPRNEPPAQEEVATPPEGASFYKYTDANGVIHFVDNEDSIPPAYRNRVTKYKDREKGQTTSVKIVGDQVLVPVTLRNGSIAVQVWLVLDTGATVTTIHEDVAARLNIDWNATRGRSARIANGSQVATRSAMLDSITVGTRASSPIEVSIMPFQGEKGINDGLLGMNFLRDHRFHIDFANQQLRWD